MAIVKFAQELGIILFMITINLQFDCAFRWQLFEYK